MAKNVAVGKVECCELSKSDIGFGLLPRLIVTAFHEPMAAVEQSQRILGVGFCFKLGGLRMKISTWVLAGTLGAFAATAYAQSPLGTAPGMSPAPTTSQSGMGGMQGQGMQGQGMQGQGMQGQGMGMQGQGMQNGQMMGGNQRMARPMKHKMSKRMTKKQKMMMMKKKRKMM